MSGEIIVNGVARVRARVEAMQRQIERNKDHAARAAANLIRRAVRQEAPKGATGKLKRSVRVLKVPGGYVVKPQSRVAHLVIRGTKAHEIDAQAKPLRFFSGGAPVFAMSAKHPGSAANPFVQRAYNFATRTEAVSAAKATLFHDAPVPED